MQKAYRIRKNGQFHYVFRKGKSMGTHLLSLVYVRAGKLQVGFAVNKKVGHAVVRNRARRVIRAAYAEVYPALRGGYDIVFVARYRTAGCKSGEIALIMRKHLAALGVLP